jgi:osmotically-inducible protein OsmY
VDGLEDAEAAETVVWAVPGVLDVHDEIAIRPLVRERARRGR